jgi:fructokinase
MRIGIDLGGTKIEAVALADEGGELMRFRLPTPRGDYAGTIAAIAAAVARIEGELAATGTVGVGMPGAVSPRTGLVKNANSTWLNGRPFRADIAAALGREVRCANDADCLAVSEAVDGAAAGAEVAFAVILGTGVGAGIALGGRALQGRNAVAGEWGHNPLPWPEGAERPGPPCWCGRTGCIETFLSGPALARDYREGGPAHAASPADAVPPGDAASPTGTAASAGGPSGAAAAALLDGPAVVAAAEAGEPRAEATLARYEHRLARALAHAINLLDPDVVVLGGGLSRIPRLYRTVPPLIPQWVFGGECDTPLLPAAHGDASGVRGAAWLWGGDGR